MNRQFVQRTAIFLGILLVLAAIPTTAATITVDDSSGGADYTSIQEAIDDAVAGDTILVYPGNYTGDIDVNKKLTIISKSGNPANTIVRVVSPDGFLSDDAFYVTADGVVISGFTITGATIDNYGDDQAGVHLEGSQNCVISNNYLSNNIGLSLTQSNNNTLINNTVVQNKVIGILLQNSSYNEITRNNVTLNNHVGIALHAESNKNTLSHNIISHPYEGIRIASSYGNTVVDNTFLKGWIHEIDAGNNILFNNTVMLGNSSLIFDGHTMRTNDSESITENDTADEDAENIPFVSPLFACVSLLVLLLMMRKKE